MKRIVDTIELKKFIEEHYKTVSEFRKAIKVSQSHLYALLKGKVKLGDRVLERLKEECEKHNTNLKDLVRPIPIIIGNDKAEMINITKDGVLIASITAENIIVKNGYKCEMVPY